MKRLQRVAPHENGFPIHFNDLTLPETRLDFDYAENRTNHHRFFYARTFGQTAILQTLRDLDTSQIQAPRDTHNTYHKLYMPAPTPSLHDALEHIEEAKENGVELRYGSAMQFRKVPISDNLMSALLLEYNTDDTDKRRKIFA